MEKSPLRLARRYVQSIDSHTLPIFDAGRIKDKAGREAFGNRTMYGP